MVADAADGADGVARSVLARGRYPDCPRSQQPPFAAEDDLNPECAEEGLRPPQPVSAGGSLASQSGCQPWGCPQHWRQPAEDPKRFPPIAVGRP
jgi:hypothetical protein